MSVERADSGSKKRLSIELQGKVWARKKAVEMKAGLENSILIVRETEKYKRLLALPPLTGEEEIEGWGVRVDNLGNIHTPVWRIKETKLNDENQRDLVNPEGYLYKVMNRKRIRRNFFGNLPKGLPVNELISASVGSDIETAIRQQRHILDGYQPGTGAEEVQLARRVVEHTDRLASRYISEGRPVREEDLRLLSKETGHLLEEMNLVDPRDPEKQKMLQMLLKVNLKDSLGRVNPLVQRVRARAAYLAAAKRLVVGGMITRKFASNEQVLLYERENTRWALQTAFRQMNTLLGHADFNSPDGSATKKQRAAIANILMNISEGHLMVPRVKPYLRLARYIAVNLNGSRAFEQSMDRQIIGEDIADRLFSRSAVRSVIMDGNFSEAKGRIENSCQAIDAVLYEHESI
ncbi:MAG: hypothetical protein ACC618_02765 [Patescibacteria group bacterium]